MRLLFIKLKHIGDALLLTPTLVAARAQHPSAQIWVVVRRGSEGILQGCSAIDRICVTAPPEASRRSLVDAWRALGLVRELRRQRFDWAFELSDGDRGRLLARLSGARNAAATGVDVPMNWLAHATLRHWTVENWTSRHRVEKDYHTVRSFIPLSQEIPGLAFERGRTRDWSGGRDWGGFVVLHPCTRWKRKQWPVDRWIELGRRFQKQGEKVVVSCGPDPGERATAAEIVRALGEASAISTDGTTDWAQLAGLLCRAHLFVGVDTAAMHLAAACQCPTVAIFGPSVVHQWQPWSVPRRVVSPPPDAIALNPEHCIQEVTLEASWTACTELMAAFPDRKALGY